MVKIKATDYLDRFLTNEDGMVLFNIISPILEKGEKVVVSFEDVDCLPTSFVNTAFIPLLGILSFTEIKKLLSFEKTNSQINNVIKMRFFDELES